MNPKSNMRKGIESWRSARSFPTPKPSCSTCASCWGKACLVQVVHTDDGQYANVANIMAPPKGTAKLKAEGTCVYYGPDDDAQYDALPQFLKSKVDGQLASAPSAPATKPASKPVNPEDAFAEEEVERQAQRKSSKGVPLDDFSDADLPF